MKNTHRANEWTALYVGHFNFPPMTHQSIWKFLVSALIRQRVPSIMGEHTQLIWFHSLAARGILGRATRPPFRWQPNQRWRRQQSNQASGHDQTGSLQAEKKFKLNFLSLLIVRGADCLPGALTWSCCCRAAAVVAAVYAESSDFVQKEPFVWFFMIHRASNLIFENDQI